MLRENYFARSESYIIAMEEMFKQIPQTVESALTAKETKKKLMTDIGGGWYLKKCEKGLPPLKRKKLSKKAQGRHDLIKKNFMNIICGGMIGNYYAAILLNCRIIVFY